MQLGDLLNDTFLGKIVSLFNFLPTEVTTLIFVMLGVVCALAIWRAIIGG